MKCECIQFRALYAAGVRRLVTLSPVLNCCSADESDAKQSEALSVGSFVVLRDHINVSGGNPLFGHNEVHFWLLF